MDATEETLGKWTPAKMYAASTAACDHAAQYKGLGG
jgi:hypothetical protein